MTWKALSLTQPWAFLVVSGDKSVENRKWATSHRGEFLVHAAKKCTPADWQFCFDWVDEHIDRETAARIPPREALQFGGIIGRAVIADVLSKNGQMTITPVHTPGVDLRWWMRGQAGFLLTERAPLPFIACKGAMGMFGVPADVGALVDVALRRRAA